ncbi:Inosine-5'-monophosphate dehydrogenase [Candidatus Gugararchaeum adminiculabundum]|nr:Inosine-5'-monophosphate dehydrogenase [Candidatus Gugararchaeum adminiculabundum]
MRIDLVEEKFTYDDILIVPQHTTIGSRTEISTDHIFAGIKVGLPVISAAMDTVTTFEMAKALQAKGGLAAFPRESKIEIARQLAKDKVITSSFYSIGVNYKPNELEALDILSQAGGKQLINIDIAHGDCAKMEKALDFYSKKYPSFILMAGNVATPDAALRLSKAGADIVKAGIGPGAVCSTRINTGVGYPQASAIMEVRKKYDGALVADGGVNYIGDVCKALAIGADAVMIGRLFAQTSESAGKIVEIGGKKFKEYRGMASPAAKANRNEKDSKRFVEGESFMVPIEGSVLTVLDNIRDGLLSAMSYSDSRTIKEFKTKADLVRISGATARENSIRKELK